MELLKNYLFVFLISFTVAFSGALMPGPLLAGVIYESSRRGFKAGPLMILGHALAEIAMIISIFLGITRLIKNVVVLQSISMLGALVMLYFGVNMFLSIAKFSMKVETLESKSPNLILKGVTLSAGNPYWSIWWLTIGIGLLLSARNKGILAIAIFFLGHIMADMSWYSIISAIVARGSKFIPMKVYKVIVILLGVFLICLGLYFAKQAFYPTPSP